MFIRRDNLVSFMLLLWELFHEIELFLPHEFYISTLLQFKLYIVVAAIEIF